MKHSSTEQEPAVAVAVCGDGIEALRQLAKDVARYGEELGLVGPRELDRLWTRHIINSAVLAPKLTSGTLADIGSGAGFPGLVGAAIRRDVTCTLIEPLGRRAQWLSDESARMGLTNVIVVPERAEEMDGAGVFDQVTARAVSALSTLLPMATRLARSGGELLLMKGQRVDQEVREAAAVMVSLGLKNPRVETTGLEYGTEETRIFRATVA